jgi:hypothetical protein
MLSNFSLLTKDFCEGKLNDPYTNSPPKLSVVGVSNTHHVQPIIVLMQYSTDTTPIFWIVVSHYHVVLHPIQPMVEEVVVSMQPSVDPTLILESDKSKEVTMLMKYLVNPTLLLWGDASFDHAINIFSLVPSKQGIIPLSARTLP